MSPTPVDADTRSLRATWAGLWPYLRQDLWLYGLALLLAPATAASTMIQPWILQRAIDHAIVPKDLKALGVEATTFLLVVLGGFLFQVGHTLLLSLAAMRTITRLRHAIFQHTITRSQAWFDHQPTGRLLTRATNDVETLGETLTAGAITIVLDALQVVGVLSAMFWFDAKLTLTLLLVAPPLGLFLEFVRRRLRGLFDAVRNALAEMNSYMSERLAGVEIVQLYADEARTLGQFEARNKAHAEANIRTNVYDALLYATVDGVTSVTLALMLWYGSGGILSGVLTAGMLAAFMDYVGKLFRPVQEFSSKVAVIQRAVASLEKILGLLEVQDAVVGGDVTLAHPKGHVKLEHVSFAYGDGPTILHDVSLEIRPGEVVALCGRTGSGKTTIGKLLTRMYDGHHGTILLDGAPIETLATGAVRRMVGSVQQDVQLFPGTVRSNLTLGHEIGDDTLMAAVRMVRAEDVVARLGGLDGRVDEGGKNLSGGEAQLLSFARTMAHDPAVVVLDEATASVDSLTEARIQEATSAILSTKTTLVIAHRLSTIVGATRIVLLDQGRVLETGSHHALMAQNGSYAALFREQFHELATE